MIYCYFGHHKMATTFITSIMERIASYVGLNSEVANLPSRFNYNLGEHLLTNETRFLSYVNANSKYVNQITKPFRGFHVIRDPRDCIVSAYFSHRNSHSTVIWPELLEHRQKLLSLSTEEGLIAEINFSKELPTDGDKLDPYSSIIKWNYNQHNILELRYELMIKDQTTFFVNVLDFLGILSKSNLHYYKKMTEKLIRNNKDYNPALKKQKLLEILNLSSFSKLAEGRVTGLQNDASHYRKGISGDYVNYFTPEVKACFKQNYPGLLENLQYEVNDKW